MSNKEIEVRFVDVSQIGVINWHPITLASKTESISDIQKEKMGKDHFVACPGIADYRNQGWIMSAWTDFHIYASDKETMVYYGDPTNDRHKNENSALHDHYPITPAGKGLSADIPKYLPIHSDILYPKPMHVVTPWAIESKDISCMLMPAYYHGDAALKIHIYPGIVDFTNGFNTMNMIFAPLVKGHTTIRAGTPLVQIIPLQKGKFKSVCETADTYDMNKRKGIGPAGVTQYYRRFFQKKSKMIHRISNADAKLNKN